MLIGNILTSALLSLPVINTATIIDVDPKMLLNRFDVAGHFIYNTYSPKQ